MPLNERKLKFKASTSPDVVRYRLYVEEASNPVTYNSEFVDIGNPVDHNNYIIIPLSNLEILTSKDGTYNLGVTPIDDAGNEGSMVTVNNVELDFLAPDPVTELEIIN